MFNNYEFFSAVRIVSGLEALSTLTDLVNKLAGSNVFIITDQGIVAAKAHLPVIEVLTAQQLPYTLFDQVPADGSIDSVFQAKQLFLDSQSDIILAVGGGSVIDTAKALNIAISLPEDLEKYMGVNNLPHRLKPCIIIPTTAGTGSEVTAVAIVADNQKKTKLIFNSPYLMADYAILDPKMTLNLPLSITAMTAMDALTHCIESYTCNSKNPISSQLAFLAIKKILTHLPIVLDNPQNQDSRLELAEASTMAGMAFSNSMVGLTHSLAHAVGVNFGVAHGLCCSIFLPHVLRFNQAHILEELNQLSILFLDQTEYLSSDPQQRASRMIQKISNLKQILQHKARLPAKLSLTEKVKPSDFDFIINKALIDGSIIYNPIKPSQQEVLHILEQAW